MEAENSTAAVEDRILAARERDAEELASLRAFAASVERATGASGAEALALIARGTSAAARVAALEAQVTARDADAAIARASAEGRLPPAMQDRAQAVLAELGLTALNHFLAMLPRVAPVAHTSLRQAAPRTEGASVDVQVERNLLAKGFSPAEIKAAVELPTTHLNDLMPGETE